MGPVIVVGRVRNVAAGVAHARLHDAGHLSDQVPHPPEAAACQNRAFRLHCHVITYQVKHRPNVVSLHGLSREVRSYVSQKQQAACNPVETQDTLAAAKSI